MGLDNLPFLQWDVDQPWGRFLESPIPVDLEPSSPTSAFFSSPARPAPAQPVPVVTSTEACAACGNMMMADALFCRKCGTKRGFAAASAADQPLTATFELSASGTRLRYGEPGHTVSSPQQAAAARNEDGADDELAAIVAEEAELMREVNSLDMEAARISAADGPGAGAVASSASAAANHDRMAEAPGGGLEGGIIQGSVAGVVPKATRHPRPRPTQPGRSARAGHAAPGSARAARPAPSRAQHQEVQQEDQVLSAIEDEEAMLMAELGGLEARAGDLARLGGGQESNMVNSPLAGVDVATAQPTPAMQGQSNAAFSPPAPPARKSSPAPPKAGSRQQRPPRPPRPPHL